MYDDLKDAETDKKLFKERPLPRGAVTKKDIITIATIIEIIAIILINSLGCKLKNPKSIQDLA